jgi:hypothetical protein
MLRGVIVFSLMLSAAETAWACGRCGFTVCRFQPATTHHSPLTPHHLPLTTHHTDQSFHVSYTLHFPPPALAGTTGFAYGPPQFSVLDPALFLNAASRYMDTAQAAAQKGFTEFNQSAALVIDGQRSLAELQARAALLAEANKLLGSAPPAANLESLRINRAAAQPSAEVRTIIADKCLRCHGAGKADGGLNLSAANLSDRALEAKILDRITTADPSRRMPKGGTLTVDEITAFFRATSPVLKTDAAPKQPAN